MHSIIQNSSWRNWVFTDQDIRVNILEDEPLCYMTEIRINDDNTLNFNDSSLNLPERLKISQKQGLVNLNFRYSLNKKPGFVVKES